MSKHKNVTTMSNDLYDMLKFFALIALPAAAALYFGLASIWGLPKAEEVVGTITVVDTFLGVLLGISSSKYTPPNEGQLVGFMNVTETPQGKHVALEFPGDPHDIDKHDKVTFKVRKGAEAYEPIVEDS